MYDVTALYFITEYTLSGIKIQDAFGTLKSTKQLRNIEKHILEHKTHYALTEVLGESVHFLFKCILCLKLLQIAR